MLAGPVEARAAAMTAAAPQVAVSRVAEGWAVVVLEVVAMAVVVTEEVRRVA